MFITVVCWSIGYWFDADRLLDVVERSTNERKVAGSKFIDENSMPISAGMESCAYMTLRRRAIEICILCHDMEIPVYL